MGACTGRDVSEEQGEPEYVEDGSERVESIGSHVSGSSSGWGCSSEKGTWDDGPWFNSSCGATPSRGDMPRSFAVVLGGRLDRNSPKFYKNKEKRRYEYYARTSAIWNATYKWFPRSWYGVKPKIRRAIKERRIEEARVDLWKRGVIPRQRRRPRHGPRARRERLGARRAPLARHHPRHRHLVPGGSRPGRRQER